MKTVLLVEDDPQQSEAIKNAVERNYPLSVISVETESDFRACVASPTFKTNPPVMVISDVMLPWAYNEQVVLEVPPEVQSGTFRRAGNRCWGLFREHAHLKSIPWIYFTVLDKETIEFANHRDDFTGYAQKAGSLDSLFREMDRFLQDSSGMRRRLAEGLKVPLGDCVTEAELG